MTIVAPVTSDISTPVQSAVHFPIVAVYSGIELAVWNEYPMQEGRKDGRKKRKEGSEMGWDGEGPSRIHSRTHSLCGFNLIEGAAASLLPLLRWDGYRGNCNSFGKESLLRTLYRLRWIGLPHMSVRFLGSLLKALIQVSLYVQIARIALQARRTTMLLLLACCSFCGWDDPTTEGWARRPSPPRPPRK